MKPWFTFVFVTIVALAPCLALALPDLVVTSLTDPPPTPCQKGVGITMYVTVRNQGTSPTTIGDVYCEWFLSTDQTWSSNDYDISEMQGTIGRDLQPGESYTFTMPTNLPALDAVPNGYYYVIGYVDYGNFEQESNENNNTRSTNGRTQVTGGAVRDPAPSVYTHTVPTQDTVNRWMRAAMYLTNLTSGGPAAQGDLTMSFPSFTQVSDTYNINVTHWTTGLNIRLYRPGSVLYKRGGGTVVSTYWMVEANWPSTWPPGDSKEMWVEVRPQVVGTFFHSYIRGSMEHSTNSGSWFGDPTTGPRDQQDWWVYDHSTWVVPRIGIEVKDSNISPSKPFEVRTLVNPTSLPAFDLMLPSPENVILCLYNAAGQKVEEQTKFFTAGAHRITWNRKLPPGVYFLQAKAGEKTTLARSVIIR